MTEQEFRNDWIARFGDGTPLTSANVAEYITQRDAGKGDGWIAFSGNSRPVAAHTKVIVKLASGEVLDTARADMWIWRRHNPFDDIIAYKVVA